MGGGQRDGGRSKRVARPVIEPIDRTIAAITAVQHTNITREQLIAAGLGPDAIDHWVARGRLHRQHRGVYALVAPAAQPALAPHMAAVLACGKGAVLSHGAAAAVWGFRGAVTSAIDVTAVSRHPRPRGVRVHRTVRLDPLDIRRVENIPITAPARTLLDIAPELLPRDLERAFDEAIVQRLITRGAVRAALRRARGRPGTGSLVALTEMDRPRTATRSRAEESLLALIRKGGLGSPRVNARVGHYEVDFLWPDSGLVVEVDGFSFHGSRSAFERDRRRDAELQAMGFRVMRVTWRQLANEPEALLVRLAQALVAR